MLKGMSQKWCKNGNNRCDYKNDLIDIIPIKDITDEDIKRDSRYSTYVIFKGILWLLKI